MQDLTRDLTTMTERELEAESDALRRSGYRKPWQSLRAALVRQELDRRAGYVPSPAPVLRTPEQVAADAAAAAPVRVGSLGTRAARPRDPIGVQL